MRMILVNKWGNIRWVIIIREMFVTLTTQNFLSYAPLIQSKTSKCSNLGKHNSHAAGVMGVACRGNALIYSQHRSHENLIITFLSLAWSTSLWKQVVMLSVPAGLWWKIKWNFFNYVIAKLTVESKADINLGALEETLVAATAEQIFHKGFERLEKWAFVPTMIKLQCAKLTVVDSLTILDEYNANIASPVWLHIDSKIIDVQQAPPGENSQRNNCVAFGCGSWFTIVHVNNKRHDISVPFTNKFSCAVL